MFEQQIRLLFLVYTYSQKWQNRAAVFGYISDYLMPLIADNKKSHVFS